MRNLIKYYLPFIGVFSISFGVTKSKQDFISFQLTDRSEAKAVPNIIFYIDTFGSKGFTVLEKPYKVEEKELQRIENVIKNNASYLIIDSDAYRYYDFTVINKGNQRIFGTVNRTKTIQLLKLIIEELHSSKIYPEVSNTFEYLYSQLPKRGD